MPQLTRWLIQNSTQILMQTEVQKLARVRLIQIDCLKLTRNSEPILMRNLKLTH